MTDVRSDQRVSLTIPFPSYEPRTRGIHAKDKFGTYWKVKCSLEEENLVNEAAAKAGLTKSEFVRWCAVKAARKVVDDVDPVQT